MHHSKFVLNNELPSPLAAKFRTKDRTFDDHDVKYTLFSGSNRVVLAAVGVNAINTAMKFAMWAYTGSHSLFAEGIHSLADTVNQVVNECNLSTS